MTGTRSQGRAVEALVSASTGARVLDFRRRGAPPRRRRRSLLLALARPLTAAVVSVALPIGLVSWVFCSRRFQLREVAVAPTQRVPAAWVRTALAPLTGENLVRLSLAEAAARVARNPWIAAVDLAKELPDRLRVAVTERRPVVLLRGGGGLFYGDAQGLPIAPVASSEEAAAARRSGLLVVSFPRPDQLQRGIAGALAVAKELERVRPEWAAGLNAIDALGEDDFRLHTAALAFPLLVTRGRLASHLRRFEELLPELRRRYNGLAAVDLRISRRIVVQPLPPAPLPAAAQTGAAAGRKL